MPASRQNVNAAKWPIPLLRPGMTHYQGVVRALWRSLANVQSMATMPLDANFTVGASDVGKVVFLRDAAGALKFSKAIDTGPANWSNYPSLLVVTHQGADSPTTQCAAIPHGVIDFGAAHGVTPGVQGYLSSSTTGLIVPNEGATGSYSDAHTPAQPLLLGIYLSGNEFLFHPYRPV